MLGIADMFASLDGYERYELALAAWQPTRDRDRKAERTAAVKAGACTWRHGLARYSYGCRCSVCRAANTEYMREYQRRRARDPIFRAQRRGYDRKRRAGRKAKA